MTAPNVQITSLTQQIGSSVDGINLLPAAFRRSMPTQLTIPVANTGSVTVFSANDGTAAASANATIAPTTIGLSTANSIKANLAANEVVLCVTKPTAQAGLGILGATANATDSIQITWMNATAANITPTANETMYCAVARGLNTIAIPAGQGLAANLAVSSIVEQTINVGGSGAIATPYINAAGQITAIYVNSGGSQYYVPPTVVISGTGNGATALATVVNGVVTNVVVTNGGQGYTAATSVSFIGGTAVAPGMFAAINETTANVANRVVGNVRVAGPNQLAVCFVNPTSGANVSANANMTFSAFASYGMTAPQPIIQCSANLTTMVATGANAANITAMNVNNIAANDICIGVAPALANSNYAMAGATCAANTINLSFFSIAATPGAGTYTAAVYRNPATPPMQVYSVYLAPTAVSNNTTAEQVFTLPSNVTLLANSAIGINKPSYTPGIQVVGARANSTTTLGVTYMNLTTGNITPPAEFYTIASFSMPTVALTTTSNATTGAVTQFASITNNQMVNLLNEVQQDLVVVGTILGA